MSVLYSFTFPYIETSDIKVSLDDTPTTEYGLANATTVQFDSPPGNGVAIRIFRQTDADDLKATFFPGSAIRAQDLNDNFEQALYVAQETFLSSETADGASRQAIAAAEAAEASAAQAATDAAAAVTTADQASSQVAGAVSDAAGAVQSAADAEQAAANATSTASAASVTATNAKNIAEGIEAKADQAIATANSATSTANSADSKADSAITTANSADSKADSAITTANSADSKATQAVSGSSSALSTANSADSKADQAITTANAANTAASNAVSTANSAQTTANSATSTANNAETVALGIESKADNAIAVANSASISASNAEGVASSADIKATNALSTATDAETTADSAYSIATGIDAKANQAIATADNAEDIAQNALDAVSGSSPWIGNADGIFPADLAKDVGIGTNTPSERLEVKGTSRFDGDVRVYPFDGSTEGGEVQLYNPDGASIGAVLDVSAADTARLYQTGDNSSLTIGQAAGTGGVVRFKTEGQERLKIAANGNVGVNHGNPQKSLHVGGSNNMVRLASTTGAARIEYQNSGSSSPDSTAIGSVNNDLQFVAGGSEKARINSGGNFGIGVSNPATPLHVSAAGATPVVIESSNSQSLINFRNSSTSLFFMGASSNNWNVQSSGVERLSVTSGGNVGVGVSDPSFKLDVDSKIRAGNTDGYGFLGLGKNPTDTWKNWHIVSGGNGYLSVYNGNDGEGLKRLTIGSNGNVGLGYDNPTAKLSVFGNILGQNFISTPRTGTGEGGELQLQNPDGVSNGAIIDVSSADSARFFQLNDNSTMVLGQLAGFGGTIRFHTEGSEKARISSTGKFGIGSSNPVSKLSNSASAVSDGTQSVGSNGLNWQTSNSNAYIAGFENQSTGNGALFRVSDDSAARKILHAVNGSGSSVFLARGDGYVGIGTDNPQAALHANSTNATPAVIESSNNQSLINFRNSETSNFYMGASSNNWNVQNSGIQRLSVATTGNVGVNQANPQYGLDVNGSFRFGTTSGYAVAQYGSSATSTNNWHAGSSGGGSFIFFNGNVGSGSEKLRLTSTGNLGIGTSSPEDKLSILDTSGSAGTSITAAGNAYLELDSGVGNTSGNQLSYIDFKSNGAVKGSLSINEGVAGQPLEINSASNSDVSLVNGGGNVGIGVVDPGEKLDVNGNLRVRGNLIVDGTGGGGGGGGAATGFSNVKDFGAVGNGTTDDTAAINSALQGGGAVYFPAGTYRVTSQITVENKGLHMYGDGQASRILFDPSTSGANFLDLRYNDGTPNPNQAYAISNLVIHAKQNKVCGFGVRLYFTNTTTLVGVCNKLTLTNVDIGSEFTSDANAGYFKIALKMLNSAGVVGTNLNIYTNSKTKVEYGVTDSVGIDIENSMAGHAMIRTLYLNNFYIQRYHTGIRAYSSAGNSYNSLESLYLSQGELLASKALRMERMAAITVIGIHSDVRDYFLDSSNSYGDIHYASTIRILGNDIRANRIDGEDVTTQDYLIKIKGQQTVISGNNIMSFKNTQGVIQTGGPNSNQINTVITGNHFSGNGSSAFKVLNTASGSREVRFGGNTLESFGGNLNPISNAVGSQLIVYGQRTGNNV